ncbi:MAG: SAM-dependent methyltransferase [Candidatus Magasanikbacteria bacterium]
MTVNKTIMLSTKSIWQNTKTFFPLFESFIEKSDNPRPVVCIVGASDGRFVVPLARKNYDIIAVENDPIMINGGVVEGPNKTKINVLGLKERLKIEQLSSSVKIIENNFLDADLPFLVDAVFTSSTWDCTINHNSSLKEYINKMQVILKPSGLFCAEYMMPCEEKHLNVEHFLDERKINNFFNEDWQILEEFFTPVFIDEPHVGKIFPHNHRMGFFVAKKIK